MPSLVRTLTVGLLLCAVSGHAQKFYPDDPLEAEPELLPTYDPQPRALSDILEILNNSLGSPGERHPALGVIPAGGINTLGDVMDGPWFQNRHARRRLSPEELVRGPGNERPPADGPWRILTLKKFGYRPGILIADSSDQLYLLRFDPRGEPEMGTAAEMISSRFFHALGYHVPENYIVYFERERMVLADGGEAVSSAGELRDIIDKDVDSFLLDVASDAERGYRAVATRVPGSWEGMLGPFQVFGTRNDDPNDIVPHEHRRDLRGLYVFSAWLNHTEMSAVHSLDALVSENGVPFVRHYLVDFFATLGSDLTEAKKSWRGNEKLYDFPSTFKNIAGMGVYTPAWMRSRHPGYRGVGRFHYEHFEPDRWTGNVENAAFANRLPDDTYWGARAVMAFTDDDIRAIVETGEYTDPRAVEWITRCLIERRDRIGATFFAKVLPLEDFGIEDGELRFRDLAVEHGFAGERAYQLLWSEFDNPTQEHTNIGVPAQSLEVPPQLAEAASGSYFAARIAPGDEPDKAVDVYLRKEADGVKVVGIDRDWPGKTLADARAEEDPGATRFGDLDARQKLLFESYTAGYNEATGFSLSARDYFNSLTISERTTFDAVTHALMNSELTDENGESIGQAIDLVRGVERVAGQYYGRSGDEQFRIYVFLREGARETLERSQEFSLGHLNTVYHVGYPYSYRQAGNLPSIQFSISEDSTRADIDVDYRSSKMPAAMFNGHLTSANSDVRAGDNHERHTGRWSGFVAWWQGTFGRLPFQPETSAGTGIYSRERPEVPTPLPADRPPSAEPEELVDAAQEFLTDWLVRREVGEALMRLSDQSLACLDTDDDVDDEILRNQGARAALKEAMELAIQEQEDADNLTEAIDVVLPWRESVRITKHAFEGEFSLLELTNADAAIYLCGNEPEGGINDEYGTYYATLFRFKIRDSGILGLLWARENGNWRVVAWEAFEQ